MSLIKFYQQLQLIILSSTLINQIQSSPHTNVHKISERAIENYWSYKDQKEWITLNHSQCGGDRQSPIDLDSSKARVDKTLSLEFRNYDIPVRPSSGSLVYSTGHSLKLEINSPGTYVLRGSAVDDSAYELLQAHIHWGTNSMSGSEHAIDGERFSAEVHFVHRKVNYTGHEMESPGGLTVIGVIAKNGEPNPGLDVLLKSMNTNSHSNFKLPLKYNFNLTLFLPENKKSFFRYSGSLTTPNCQEVVNWIVMKDTITVSNSQIDQLRKFIDYAASEMETVVRDLQPLQGRTIYQSDSGTSMAPTLTSIFYIILYLIVHITLIQKSTLN